MAKPQLPEALAPDLLDRLIARFAPFPLTRDWNLTLASLAPGRARLRLGPTPVTTNEEGRFVNGGVLSTIADMACALALCTAFDGAMPFVTSDLHIRFLDPAEGEVFADASVLRLSHRSAVLECHLSCPAGVAAICTAHFTIKPRLDV